MPSRYAIALMSAAGVAGVFGVGVLFGLGLLSSPRERQMALLPEPAIHAARHSETTGSESPGDEMLTPVYPTHLNGPNTSKPAQPLETEMQPASQSQGGQVQGVQVQGAQAADHRLALLQQDASAASAPVDSAAPPRAADTAGAAPASLESRNACDVDACARAYRSFRASDCTYQPYFGPRQLCTGPPMQQASRSHMLARFGHLDRRVNLNAVAREVERITGGWD